MRKRITALLLALCLTLTCALGAWAEEPEQTGGGQNTETVTGSEEASGEDAPAPAENADDPAESKPANGEDSAPGEGETAPDGNEPQEGETTAGGPENGGNAAGEPNSTTTDNSEADGSETDESESGPGDNADDGQYGIALCSAPEGVQQVKDILDQFTLWPCIYDETGGLADLNNIVVDKPLTIYYAICRLDGPTNIRESTPAELTAALGTDVWKAVSYVSPNSSEADYGDFITETNTLKPPYSWGEDGPKTAYWKQTITPRESGSIELRSGLTMTVGGSEVSSMSGQAPFTVRQTPISGGAATLNEKLDSLQIEWLNRSVTGPQEGPQTVNVGDEVQLALYGFQEHIRIDDTEDFITGLSLDPNLIKVEWRMEMGDTSIFAEAGPFMYNDADDRFGSQKFTAVARGAGNFVFELYYDGQLVQIARTYFEIHGTDALIDIQDANTFPDEKLRAALQKYDTSAPYGQIDLDTEFHGYLDLSNCGITDLTGLEKFEGLQTLDISQNGLTGRLDVSELTSLRGLYVHENNITDLDVSALTGLQTLGCAGNRLETLDVSKNTALKELDCSANRLKTLTVNGNADLEQLRCSSNRLEALDVGDNKNLVVLYCSANYLTELDLRNNTGLQELYVSGNQMPSLELANNRDLTTTDLGPITLYSAGMQMVDTTYTVAGDKCIVTLPADVDTVYSFITEESYTSNGDGTVTVPDGEQWALAYEWSTNGPETAETMIVALRVREADKTLYKVIEGDKEEIVVDGKTPLVLLTNIQAGKEIWLSIDGQPVPSDQFSVEADGSNTKITVNASYLRQFTARLTYFLEIDTDDGYATTYFYVIANMAPLLPDPAGEEDSNDGDTAPAKEDEYIVCKACGHQTWEPYLDGWRCTNCGYLRGTTGVPAAAAAKAAPAAYRGTIPQTADEFPLAGVAAVFCVSLAGLGALLLLRKKQR